MPKHSLASPAEAPAQKIKLERNDNSNQVIIRVPRKRVMPQASTSSPRNVIAGLALTVACVSSGLWFVRQRGGAQAALKMTTTLAILVGLAGCWWWDKNERKTPESVVQPVAGDPGAVVHLTDDEDEIRIILPKKLADQIKVNNGANP